jgi:hypothetical protein
MRIVFYMKVFRLKYRGLHCIFCRISKVAVFFVEFTFWQIFHKLFGIKYRIFWWMFSRFTYGGFNFSLSLILLPEVYIPRRCRLQFFTVREHETSASGKNSNFPLLVRESHTNFFKKNLICILNWRFRPSKCSKMKTRILEAYRSLCVIRKNEV